MKQFIKLGLTDRHAGEGMPAMDGFVFPSNINDVTDVKAMDKMAAEAILPLLSFERVAKTALANAELSMGEQVVWESDKGIDLYVTGLTSLTAAVIKLAAHKGIPLTLWHFDRATGDYFPQVIFS